MQGGFDEGFPLGAALAMRVGYLLEVVKEISRKGSREDGEMRAVGSADGRAEDVEDDEGQTLVKTWEAQLADAERELSLESLVREMETLDVLREDAIAGLGQPSSLQNTVGSLPSISKWSRLVECRGKAASPG